MSEVKKESFEKRIEKLQEIAKSLQDPSTELEKAVDLYESGMKLAREVDQELSAIERKIEIVTSGPEEDCVVTAPYTKSE